MVNVVQAYEMVSISKRAKEVKPDGHGEATRSYELHLNKLASVSPTIVVP
jgi:hypothetical protein